jgi:hypothetical protein
MRITVNPGPCPGGQSPRHVARAAEPRHNSHIPGLGTFRLVTGVITRPGTPPNKSHLRRSQYLRLAVFIAAVLQIARLFSYGGHGTSSTNQVFRPPCHTSMPACVEERLHLHSQRIFSQPARLKLVKNIIWSGPWKVTNLPTLLLL